MTEVQKHAFIFEDWVKEILGVKELATKYTQKWDVEGETPISVKFMGIKNAVEFSSTVRIWEINETFTLVIGRWKQFGNNKKIVSIDEIDINKKDLALMRGGISLEEIKDFDQKIKLFPAGKEGQKLGKAFAEKWKKDRKQRMGLLTITYKIDSKNQRRIQCNLNGKNYIKLFGKPSRKAEFRGHVFNNLINHGQRKFNKKILDN